jgi:hypothetical protein
MPHPKPTAADDAFDQLTAFAMVLDEAGTLLRNNTALPAPVAGEEGPFLAKLIRLRGLLHAPVPNVNRTPAMTTGRQARERWDAHSPHVYLDVTRLVAAVDNSVELCLRRGASHPQAVLSSDFGRFRRVTVPLIDGDALYLLGEIDSLPPGHPLRDLPPADLYEVEAGTLCLVIGLAKEGDPNNPLLPTKPPVWFCPLTAARVTKEWERRRRAQVEERRQEEERRAAEMAYRLSPAGKAEARAAAEVAREVETAALKARVAELEAARK